MPQGISAREQRNRTGERPGGRDAARDAVCYTKVFLKPIVDEDVVAMVRELLRPRPSSRPPQPIEVSDG